MKFKNIATIACFSALGMMALTSCEGSELYSIGAPDWLSERIDASKNTGDEEEEELVGMQEDVYTVGNTDFTSGWWQAFSKYYQIPDGQKFNVVFNLSINPNASNTYKNFAMIISNDVDRGGTGYAEYGAIRYDNQPSGNSEWGDYIDRSAVQSTLTFNTDTDAGVDKLGGRVVVTIDRTDPNAFFVKMTNGTVTKTYTQTSGLAALNPDGTNSPIRIFFVPEGSYINFLQANIEPIGGYTSAEDKQPLSMELSGVPSEVLLGSDLNEAMANVTAVVNFEQGVTKNVTAEDLQFQAIPDMNELGVKNLVVLYNKTFKGANADKPIIASKTFKLVKEYSAFTQTVVVPSPLTIGAEDNSTAFWGAHTENIKIEPKETKVVNFTNYSSCANNWNNFCVVLCKADNAEYAVVRADNYGWGPGYAACTPTMEENRNWDTWRAAMDGAKVTAYITNNGDGTADVKAVMVGNDGKTYTQSYKGINTVDPDNFYFRFTVDGCHLLFDNTIGATDNSTGFWGAHSSNVQVIGKQISTITFTNYSSCANNWNNFCVVLCKADNTEYAVVRADNYGWGTGYAACTPAMEEGRNWDTWRASMNGAKVTVKVSNNGDGTADVSATMLGNDGKTYTQSYAGINGIDVDDFYYRFTVDGSHIVFE